ncbi:hypothetical protein A6A27_31725 [Micromonospora sp. CB01531]|nr:hypothetical protein A6A27_31725 [Micromonospora sp. CB01531]
MRPPLPRREPSERGVTGRGFTGRADAMAWFAAEQRVLIDIVGRAKERGRPRMAWQVAVAMQECSRTPRSSSSGRQRVSTGVAAAGDGA